MVAHYISAWYYVYLVQVHILFVHEQWKASAEETAKQDSNTPQQS
jgi:hypothetical protein